MANNDYGDKRTKCGLRNPCVLIRKLVELMEEPLSTHHTTRHLEILNEFLNASHYAFWLQDIPYIIRLYEMILKKINTIPEYEKPLECLLHFSAIPPMMTKSSDKLEFARDLQEYFNVLGYLLLTINASNEINVKNLALTAIKRILEPKTPIGYCCVPVEFSAAAVEKSELPAILTQLVQFFDEDLSPSLLDVVYTVCELSTTACHKMLDERMLDHIILQLDPNWRERTGDESKARNPTAGDKNPLLDDLCCILWQLLNAIDGMKDTVAAPSVFSLWSLQYAFRWTNFSEGQKLNRNNLTAIILKMFTIFPLENFQESGIFEDIVILSGALAGCPCHSVLEFAYTEVDFQYKKLVWACLHKVYDMKIIEEKEVMKAFLKYIFYEHPTTKNLDQFCTMIKILLKLVPKYLPCSMDIFIKLDGALTLINMTARYLSQIFDSELLEAHMYCISNMLMAGVDEALKMFAEKNLANNIILIIKKVLDVPTLTKDFQRVLAHGFCILQILCATDHVTNADAITLCINYLKRVIEPNQNDPLIDIRVTICAIHLLWDCITASSEFYQQFLKEGGMYIMLDIAEASAFPLKSVSLGILADACEKSACVPYLITWRKHGVRIIPMLMEIFRHKTEKGCHPIRRSEIPQEKLNSNKLLTLCHRPLPFHLKRVSDAELLKRSRSRIHAIMNAVKVKFKDKVVIANETYRLFNEKLNADDQLTKLFADNFLSLMLCQAWLLVAKELKLQKIIPVKEDNDQLVEKIHGIRQWKSYLQTAIRRIVEQETQQEYFNEFTTYSTLKEGRLSAALDALGELRYISNSTEKMFQLRKKIRLQKEVETVYVKNANFHRTICDLPVTNTFNQTISIQSNIIYEKKEEYDLHSPVSSSSLESLTSFEMDHPLSEPQLEC